MKENNKVIFYILFIMFFITGILSNVYANPIPFEISILEVYDRGYIEIIIAIIVIWILRLLFIKAHNKTLGKDEKITKETFKKIVRSIILILFVSIVIKYLAHGCVKEYENSGTAGTISETKASLRGIQSALELYNYKYGYYPKDLTELIKEDYLQKGADKDPWGRDYYYKATVESKQNIATNYFLRSAGRDGIVGNDDDIMPPIDASKHGYINVYEYSDRFIEFYQEKVLINVESDVVRVSGLYYFKNTAKKEAKIDIEYPFPVDKKHEYPFKISVKENKNIVKFEKFFLTNISFKIIFKPLEYKQYTINYEQKIKNNSAKYILTTTKYWGKNLALAEFTIAISNTLKDVKINYTVDKIEKEKNYTYYYITYRNFMPKDDILIKWNK